MKEKLAIMGRNKLQTTSLKNFAQKELAKHYPSLRQLISSMPDFIDAHEYVGWIGAILKLMSLCEADRGGNKVVGG